MSGWTNSTTRLMSPSLNAVDGSANQFLPLAHRPLEVVRREATSASVVQVSLGRPIR